MPPKKRGSALDSERTAASDRAKKEKKIPANRIDNSNSRMDTYYSTMGQSTLDFNKTAITIDSLDF